MPSFIQVEPIRTLALTISISFSRFRKSADRREGRIRWFMLRMYPGCLRILLREVCLSLRICFFFDLPTRSRVRSNSLRSLPMSSGGFRWVKIESDTSASRWSKCRTALSISFRKIHKEDLCPVWCLFALKNIIHCIWSSSCTKGAYRKWRPEFFSDSFTSFRKSLENRLQLAHVQNVVPRIGFGDLLDWSIFVKRETAIRELLGKSLERMDDESPLIRDEFKTTGFIKMCALISPRFPSLMRSVRLSPGSDYCFETDTNRLALVSFPRQTCHLMFDPWAVILLHQLWSTQLFHSWRYLSSEAVFTICNLLRNFLLPHAKLFWFI